LKNITNIIKGCISNDSNCQKQLYEQYRAFALKVVFRYIYRLEKAIDVVNDGFVKVFAHLSKFRFVDDDDNEKMLMAWLKQIMINTAIDALRRQSLTPEIGGIPDDVWDTTDKAYDADQVMLFNDLIALVKQLPPQYRIVFNLYVIDGYTHSDIAAMLHMTVSNSKSTLLRARTLLQNSVRKMEAEKLCRI